MPIVQRTRFRRKPTKCARRSFQTSSVLPEEHFFHVDWFCTRNVVMMLAIVDDAADGSSNHLRDHCRRQYSAKLS